MPAKDVDAYLANLPSDKRATLEKIRAAIRAAAPDATEGISYGMPAFIQGKAIAGYAASAKHCSYFPMSGSIVGALVDDLAEYAKSKGAIRFPVGKPLPRALIRKLVRARLAEIAAGPKKATTGGDVDEFLEALEHPRKKEIELVRRIILGASDEIAEGIKWNAPSFRTKRDWFATFHLRTKDVVQLVFHLGATVRPKQKSITIADPKRLLTWLGEHRAIVTLGAGGKVRANRSALVALVRAWIGHV